MKSSQPLTVSTARLGTRSIGEQQDVAGGARGQLSEGDLGGVGGWIVKGEAGDREPASDETQLRVRIGDEMSDGEIDPAAPRCLDDGVVIAGSACAGRPRLVDEIGDVDRARRNRGVMAAEECDRILASACL